MRKLLSVLMVPAALLASACDGGGTDPIVPEHNFTFKQCSGSSGVPFWFAVKDGDGPWTRVVGTSGTFQFTINSERAAVAYYSANDGLSVVYATKPELDAHLPECGAGAARQVTVNVLNFTTSDGVFLTMGEEVQLVQPGTGTSAQVNFPALTIDKTDLVATRLRQSGSASILEQIPDNVVFRRGITGATAPAIDYAGPDAGAPLVRLASIVGRAGDELISLESSVALSSTLGRLGLYQAVAGSGGTSLPFYGVAASRLQTGETNLLDVFASRSISNEFGAGVEARGLAVAFSDPSDRTVTLGPVIGAVNLTLGARPSASYTIQAGYDNLFYALYFQQTANRTIQVMKTKAYHGTASQVTLDVPDLTGLEGFSTQWLMQPGGRGLYQFWATTADLSFFFGTPRAYQYAIRQLPINF
jgi:hypothetical protein